MNVWNDISQDTTAIFQFESPFAAQTISALFSVDVLGKIKKEIPDISMLKLMSFANALIRPCGASIRERVLRGEFVKTGVEDIDNLLKNELYNVILQEDIMTFVNKFCGFSLPDSDKLRKFIAKKKLDLLAETVPKIKKGFIENSQKKYNLTDNDIDRIINPIIKCMYDASRYSFSQNHSDAYSFIGYACGWLRYYYPLEFITTCLNVWSNKENKTDGVVKYAKKKKILIEMPKFRYSRSTYTPNKEKNTIYKGISSIKFMNNYVAEELYELRNNEYDSFIDLLSDISTKTSVNSRQLDILIRLEFFSEFGNITKLLQCVKFFDFMKQGNVKQISKDLLTDEIVCAIIKRHSRETDKQYREIDCKSVFEEYKIYLDSIDFEEVPIKEKISAQSEFFGYIDFKTNDPKDRTKLIILEVRELKSKRTGKIWKYCIKTMSIGTGKQSELLIEPKIFKKNKLKVNDTIFVSPDFLKREVWNERVNWLLFDYQVIYT